MLPGKATIKRNSIKTDIPQEATPHLSCAVHKIGGFQRKISVSSQKRPKYAQNKLFGATFCNFAHMNKSTNQ